MIFFALAALADALSTYIVGRAGGVEGNPLLRPIPAKLRWAFQVAAYAAIAALIYSMPAWVALVVAILPAGAALNNWIRYKRSR